MNSVIDNCERYNLDKAVIETLANAGINPTEQMVRFRHEKYGANDWYGPLFECERNEGKFTLVSAFSPGNFWDGTTSTPTSSGIIYFKSEGNVAGGGCQMILGYDGMQMAGRFSDDFDLTTEIHGELESDREIEKLARLETKVEGSKVVSFTALGITEDRMKQYANLVTALYIDKAVKVLARDLGEINF